ncbi:mitochondrial intermediate peptidase, partial [Chrysoperla carnea]|uniref:mitochondrial intermediate peptidase n=1 Tax=Chrysoperla carnea TaxID=189513 RepID=UPI001D07B14C
MLRLNRFTIKHLVKKYSTLTSNKNTSLSLTFNQRPTRHKVNINQLLLSPDQSTGLFGWSTLKSPDGFYILEEQCQIKTQQLITEALNHDRKRKMVEIFDDMSDTLCKVADLAEFIRLAHPNFKYTNAAEYACIKISEIVEQLNTNRNLYNVLLEQRNVPQENSIDKHVIDLFLFDFEQSGIHLTDDQLRNYVVQLNNYILQIGQKFVNNTVQPRFISNNIPNIPKDLLINDQITGLCADSNNPLIREYGYKLYLQPDKEQEYLLDSLLDSRLKLAQTCGFQTYCDRAVKASIVETPKFIQEFLSILNDNIKSRSLYDFQLMQKSSNLSKINCWDVPYLNNKLKKDLLRIDHYEYAPYFSLGNCMEGLNMLMQSLYGIQLRNEETEPGELWSNDVYKLSVVHENEGVLGYIYCDFYERELKPNQDCHYTIQGGKQLANGYQLPIVVVMLNLPMPRWSSPTLLTPNLVDNLFHEMGHAMHSMLARTKYQHITGTRCSTDFAEVPSILMEYFANDSRVLSKFARHFQTNEQISDEMLERLCLSRNLFIASETEMQLFYSALDHRYHNCKEHIPNSTTATLAETQKEYYTLPYVENTAWQLRFSHLVGYGAKYYSYLISRAVASWIWQQYFEMDPFSRTNGERYRRECLAHGGGKPPRNLVNDLLKKECTPSNLAMALINEIDLKQDKH